MPFFTNRKFGQGFTATDSIRPQNAGRSFGGQGRGCGGMGRGPGGGMGRGYGCGWCQWPADPASGPGQGRGFGRGMGTGFAQGVDSGVTAPDVGRPARLMNRAMAQEVGNLAPGRGFGFGPGAVQGRGIRRRQRARVFQGLPWTTE